MGQILLGIDCLPLLEVMKHLLGVTELLALGIHLSPCPRHLPGSSPMTLFWVLALDVCPDPRPRFLTLLALSRFLPSASPIPGSCPWRCLSWVLALGVAPLFALGAARRAEALLVIADNAPLPALWDVPALLVVMRCSELLVIVGATAQPAPGGAS